ncbi:MAG: glycosyl transferase [Gammaproteobacteria bacterium SG8_30]|jgi:biofilm PGA synthesis N-glycosyltransferase PgaC|nr:MAG: glycosyl transferase [Gammaproteobacteria bacterium SG8_30]
MALKYVLITPARNEAAFIEETIRSVTSQTVLPEKWVIVSDGSTDDTDRIVEQYLPGREWLELVRRPVREERNFAAKVEAFNEGYSRVASVEFDVIGNIDADVSFEPDFFEFLLDMFEKNPDLGVAGTHYVEGEFHSFQDSFINVQHVNGQCQLFRRACFEDIGGYVPIRGGGIDWVAVTTARMKGWNTRSYSERVFHHHRKMGTAGTSELGARFHYGKKDYFLGGHPLWQLFRGAYQMAKPPYVLGGLSLILGYASCWLSGERRPVSDELMRFHRAEQMARLKSLFAGQEGLHRSSGS